jgi:hypothetical protein
VRALLQGGCAGGGLLRELATCQHAPGLGADYAVDGDVDATLALACPGVRCGAEVAVDGQGGQVGHVPVQQSLEFAYRLTLGALTQRGGADAVRRAGGSGIRLDVQVQRVNAQVTRVVHAAEEYHVSELQCAGVIRPTADLTARIRGQELIRGQVDRRGVVHVVPDAEQFGAQADQSLGEQLDQGQGQRGDRASRETGHGGGGHCGDGLRDGLLLLAHVTGVPLHQRCRHREILSRARVKQALSGEHPHAGWPEREFPIAAVRELDHGFRILTGYQLNRAEDFVLLLLANSALEPGPDDLDVCRLLPRLGGRPCLAAVRHRETRRHCGREPSGPAVAPPPCPATRKGGLGADGLCLRP